MTINFLPKTTIAYVENFLSNEDASSIIEAYKTSKTKVFKYKDDQKSLDFWQDKNTFVYDLEDLDKTIIHKLNDNAQTIFDKYLFSIGDKFSYKYPDFATLHRWLPDHDMEAHRDGDDEEFYTYGFILYLNKDFVGGDLYYPEEDILITPRTGLLVIHSGEILHEVLKIERGERFNMTGFAKRLPG